MHTRLAVATLALLLAGAADAASDALDLASGAPVALEGAFRASAEDGSLRVTSEALPGDAVLEGATGTVTVLTWRTKTVEAGAVEVPVREDEPRRETFEVRDATLDFSAAGGPFVFTAVSRGGRLAVEGAVDAAGVATSLDRAVEPSTGVDSGRGPEELRWRWEAGWDFVGRFAAPEEITGFPSLEDAEVLLDGALAAQAFGGTVSFVDADGRAHAIRLGSRPDEDALAAPGVGVRPEVRARLIFDGAVARGVVPAGERWGFAAPRLAWDLVGTASWRAADGVAVFRGEELRFEDADVTAEGEMALAPAPRAALFDRDYAARGDLRALAVDGRPLAPAPRVGVAGTVAAVSVLAAVAAAFSEAVRQGVWRVVALGYTRIAPDAVLDHLGRRRIVDVVSAEPGIHKRELHRRVGGAWGPFACNLRLLESAGYVRIRPDGRYAAVFPAGASAAGPPIHNPVTRRVLDALPGDGREVDFTELRRGLGLSRQVLRYHLERLASRGLVALGSGAPGDRSVRRTGGET